MPNKISKELRKKTSEELAELIVKCKSQLLQIRFNIANGEAEKLHVIPEIKKTIARSLTILNERTFKLNEMKSKKEIQATKASEAESKQATQSKQAASKKTVTKKTVSKDTTKKGSK